jgi:mannose-6-phosphate isomerase-like protein (cupin superfamily)
MPVSLEGGCRVASLREGTPTEEGSLRVFSHIGRRTGARAISLRILDFAPGRSPRLSTPAAEEVLFVLEGAGELTLAGHKSPIGPETAVYVAPGLHYEVDNPGPAPLVMVSSRCPDPDEDSPALPLVERPLVPSIVRLGEKERHATGDRSYQVLIDSAVTQFVGTIPPGRAPEHYHHYEEVLCILRGQGVMWAGAKSTPIAAGSCIYLPRKQIHCVENTGPGALVLLGAFYPAGSPAVRYDAAST